MATNAEAPWGRSPAAPRTALVVLLLVASVLVVLWLVGRTVDQSRTSAADSQLVADLQVARSTFQSDVAAAARRAAALARSPRVESAFANRDAAELDAVSASHPDTLLVGTNGLRSGALPALGVKRVAVVLSGRTPIGRVTVEAPLDASFLSQVYANMPSGTRDLLVVTVAGRVAAGRLHRGVALSASSTRVVRVQGRSYRALASALVGDRPDLRAVALVAGPASLLSAWRLPLAVVATFVGLGLLAWFASTLTRERRPLPAPRPRLEGAEQRRASIELLDEKLGASTDVDGLLGAVLDAAIRATGASGGRVVRDAEAESRVGESASGVLRVPLEAHELGTGAALLLFPPANGFNAGAADVAHWLGAHASIAIREAGLHRVAQEQGTSDELTGLPNRRTFTTTLEREFARAERRSEALAVVLCDVDDFTGIGGRLGKRGAEAALKAFAGALRRSVREIDLAARIGGERFGLLLPQADIEAARRITGRVHDELGALEGLPESLTASFGIAVYPAVPSVEELLAHAEASLRSATAQGRDRVVAGGGRSPTVEQG